MSSIFIIDDDIRIVLLYKSLIKENFPEMEIFSETDPICALKKLQIFKPDIILLDMNMPHYNGIEICKKLRSNENYSLVKIIMITGEDIEIIKDKAIEAGVNRVFSKPLKFEQILSYLSRISLEI